MEVGRGREWRSYPWREKIREREREKIRRDGEEEEEEERGNERVWNAGEMNIKVE